MTDTMKLAKEVAQRLYDEPNKECRGLALEWTCDVLMSKMIADRVPMAFECYNKLVEGNYVITNQFEYNDLDCHAFVVSFASGNRKGFVHCEQNRNFLYILREDSIFNTQDMVIYEYKNKYENYTPNLPKLNKLLTYDLSKYNIKINRAFVGKSPNFLGHIESGHIHNYARIQQALFNIESLHCGGLFE